MARPPVLPGPRPPWLKIKVPAAEVTAEVERLMRSKKLVTVCEEARCPNQHECWGIHRTATFMLLGEICTRHCGFCNIGKGKPGEVDPGEPQRVAEAVATLGLKFAVVTSVNAVLRNKPAMAVWAACIVVAVAPGFALLFVGHERGGGFAWIMTGLGITLPLIGHATWHGYRATVDAGQWPPNEAVGGL